LITQKIFGEQYRSLSSSLYSFFPFPCYLIPPRPKYPPQHPILEDTQPIFLPPCERPSFAAIQNSTQKLFFCIS
jgi:hypothetical protein